MSEGINFEGIYAKGLTSKGLLSDSPSKEFSKALKKKFVYQ